jgi:thiol-disulfide isomerase/thioredoxin
LRDTTNVTGWEHNWQIPTGDGAGPTLPLKSRLSVRTSSNGRIWSFAFTSSFRVEGHVEIDGKRTLVTLPFKTATGNVDVNNGYIGIDTDGDGKIMQGSLSPEYVSAEGKPAVLRMGERHLAVESADFATRTFVVRERPASDYTLIEVRAGSPLADFSFTDFDGRARKLSDFKDKYVLLDFWGSWCKPCVEDVPAMKEAYEKFAARGFEIVGLDYEMGGTADKVRPFLKEKGVNWVNATPESVRDLVDDRFRVNAFPTLILLGPGNIVLETSSQALRGAKLIPTLEKHLPQR